MSRLSAALLLALGGCTVSDVDYSTKGCPCIEGYRCIEARRVCVRLEELVYAPSNVDDPALLRAGTAELVVEGGERWVVDTDKGSLVGYDEEGEERTIRGPGEGLEEPGVLFRTRAPEEGPTVAIFAVRSLLVREDAQVIGVGSRPLVILAETDIRVLGAITVGADRLLEGPTTLSAMPHPGAGGYTGGAPLEDGSGPGAGFNGPDDSTVECPGEPCSCCGGDDCPTGGGGGGGASFGGAGGSGAGGSTDRVPGDPGERYGGPELVPLLGGSGGGGGAHGGGYGCSADEAVRGGWGGHGGGAVQLSAGALLVVEGVVDARGGGGKAGKPSPRGEYQSGSGGGGGSGGAIVLEAPAVVIEGRVSANGGAGGDDALAEPEPVDGEPGQLDGTAESGSTAGDGSGERGDAESATGGSVGGGGGGGAGRVRINTETGELPAGAKLLPVPESDAVSVGRLRAAE